MLIKGEKAEFLIAQIVNDCSVIANAEMEPVRVFDDRYRYRSKPVRPDRTGRSTGPTGRPATDRSTGNRPVYR